MRVPRRVLARSVTFVVLLVLALSSVATRAQQPVETAGELRAARHLSAEWLLVAPHLPDPQTASPEALAVAADVLRARRMPEDALEFYTAALDRGGPQLSLHNRIGITLLELHQAELARIHFRRVLTLDRNYAEGWNNLAATEYTLGHLGEALAGYQHAIKLDATVATYHSNLGTAYFEAAKYDQARKEFAEAVRLDPGIFDQGGWSGVQARVMSPRDHGRFCIEMARLAAQHHDEAGVVRWLTLASATEPDLMAKINDDSTLATYRKDENVVLLLRNAKLLRNRQLAKVQPAPVLPPISGVQP